MGSAICASEGALQTDLSSFYDLIQADSDWRFEISERALGGDLGVGAGSCYDWSSAM